MLSAPLSVLAPAIVLDLAVGDPVTRWHPVALFGTLAQRLFRLAPRQGSGRQLLFGAVLVVGSAGAVALAAALALGTLEVHWPLASTLVGALVLKVSFSYRQLETEVRRVAAAIEADDLEEARRSLGALVARDTQALGPSLVVSAAIESLAENLSDSLVAPVFYFLLFGVPGALAYRAVNTLDAMVGYHGEFEYLGRAAAKLDDWLSWAPARLTALLILAAALAARADGRAGLRVALRDHGLTESPNAGWPMAAIAGSLGVQLEKGGHYRLGDPQTTLATARLADAVRVARWAAAIAAALAMAISLV